MSKLLALSVDYECVGLSIERPPFYRMARILGIPRKRNAFYRMRKFLECAEHIYTEWKRKKKKLRVYSYMRICGKTYWNTLVTRTQEMKRTRV